MLNMEKMLPKMNKKKELVFLLIIIFIVILIMTGCDLFKDTSEETFEMQGSTSPTQMRNGNYIYIQKYWLHY